MSHSSKLYKWGGVAILTVVLIVGAWAVENQNNKKVTPSDFDPFNPSQIPDTTKIDFQIDGISTIGEIFMIEGLSFENQVGPEFEPGPTTFPRLVIHGVFDKNIRDWREDVRDGDARPRDMDITLLDGSGSRRLRIEIFDAWPTSFSFPPLSVDGSTRYMERVEFVYKDFDIID